MLTISRCTPSQMLLSRIENQNRYGGQSITKKWFEKKYARRGNCSYAIAVTANFNNN